MTGERPRNRERWGRIDTALDRLLELPPEERPAVLATLEPDIASEVETLLAECERSGPLDRPLDAAFESGFGTGAEPAVEPAAAGQRFGAWEVVRRLGAGGMGVVYLARRADGEYDQMAAVKVLRRDLWQPEQAERLAAERQILARLEDPGIARLIDGGVGPDGAPFLAMEWVEGLPIDEYARRGDLSIDQRLELFDAVCSAVDRAHRALVLHRDLKPSNILVRADGQVKLLDFGIAKLLDEGAASEEQTRGVPATPSHAAPEQLTGEPVGLAVDVWGLGVLLYQLLSGVHPFASDGAGLLTVQRRILGGEAPPPSRAVERRRDDLDPAARKRLVARLAGDLDSIVQKALARRPNERYGTVAELAADLRRHRQARPVRARRWTAAYRTRRFVRRHRLALAAGALVLVLVGALTALAVRHLQVTAVQAREIDRQRLHAEATVSFLVDLFDVGSGGSAPARERDAARALVERGVRQLRVDRSVPGEVRGTLLRTAGVTYRKLGLFDDARPLLTEAVELHSGARSAELAASLLALASLESDELHWDVAREHLERGLATLDEVGAPHSTGTNDLRPRLLSQLAFVERHSARLEPAEAAARQALETAESAGQRDEAERLLASILARRGLPAEAEVRYRSVLERQRRRLGSRHPDLSRTLNDLAYLLRRQSRPAEAEALYREALTILDEFHQGPHPQISTVLQNLASVYFLQGKVDETAEVLARNLEIARTLYPDSWRRASAATGLAKLEAQRDRCRAALPLLAEVAELTASWDDGGYRRGTALLTAACQLHLGDGDRARRTLDEVLPTLPEGESNQFFQNLRGDAADLMEGWGFEGDAARVREHL